MSKEFGKIAIQILAPAELHRLHRRAELLTGISLSELARLALLGYMDSGQAPPAHRCAGSKKQVNVYLPAPLLRQLDELVAAEQEQDKSYTRSEALRRLIAAQARDLTKGDRR